MRRTAAAVVLWGDGKRIVQSVRRATGVPASTLVTAVLDRLDGWTDVDALATALDLPADALGVVLDGLAAHDLVEFQGDPSASSAAAGPATLPAPWRDWSPAAYLFHLATRDVAFTRRTDAARQPEGPPRPAPVLPPQGTRHLALPTPRVPGTLRAALRDRRTHRRFALAALALQDVGTLLGITFGVQAWAHVDEGALALKTSPSGGARHSIEAYVWARHVDGVPPGVYHYRPSDHMLTALDDGEVPARVTDWLPAQAGYDAAPLLVVLAPALARVGWRYRSARACRVVLIEAGHLGQTFCLTASALGLAPFCTAALADSAIERDLRLDPLAQPVLYALGAGRPAPGTWRPHGDRPAPRVEVTALGRALDARVIRRSTARPRRPRRARRPSR